jgi:AraC family transcriptional regulator
MHRPGPRQDRSIFVAGQFLGDVGIRHRLPAFNLAHLVPTVHQDAVHEHSHSEAHYLLFMQGRYLSTAHGAPGLASQPMLIYNPPGVVHRDCFEADGKDGRFFTISVPAGAIADLLMPNYALVLDQAALQAAERIAALAQRQGYEALQLESLCTELLARTALTLEASLELAPRWLKRAQALLHDDCGKSLSLAEVAREAGVHPVHLTRVFRRYLRCTPGEYLRRCRLDKAAALIAADAARLSEIAQTCGYVDQAHLSHAFRAAYGMAPGAYRTGLLDTRLGRH